MVAMKAHKVAYHDSGGGAATSGPSCSTEAGPRPIRQARKLAVAACNDCGREFSSVDALRQHQMMKEKHTHLNRHLGSLQCQACNRTLKTQESLEQHFIADHAIIQLSAGDSERTILEQQFREQWRKPSACGDVLSVFKVYNSTWRVRRFEQHRDSLGGKKMGNEVRRYHGTSLKCDLGMGGKNSSKICQLEGCSLCSIIRSGFQTEKARSSWLRFGKGIYTTATTGKANDYIKSTSNRRAVLVCRVLSGNVFRTLRNMPSLERPPPGYDSVSGEVGVDLNYDETVVYNSNAILPGHMIVYRLA